jgi:hypothetical protein
MQERPAVPQLVRALIQKSVGERRLAVERGQLADSILRKRQTRAGDVDLPASIMRVSGYNCPFYSFPLWGDKRCREQKKRGET